MIRGNLTMVLQRFTESSRWLSLKSRGLSVGHTCRDGRGYRGSKRSKLMRWPFLLLVKFFCKTMLPHQGYWQAENAKMRRISFPSRSTLYKNHVLANLQDHG